ncbi:uncharacterized protein [Ambystoma mexicanum]|uniref:uncharacterized protein n=1 Tax=Ambystoma mexicanum TaxID=8296 RepID=UPI0037E7327D
MGVLQVIKKSGLTLKLEKCKIKCDKVSYLGHSIDAEGISSNKELKDTILGISEPENKDQLRSFLGMSEYYSKFVNDYTNKTKHMRKLMKKIKKYIWSVECKCEFEQMKTTINGAPTLGMFDCKAKTIISVDASKISLCGLLIGAATGQGVGDNSIRIKSPKRC